MYFTAVRVVELLRDIAGATRGQTQALISFMDVASGGPPRFRGGSFAVGGWLRWIGEPFQWGLAKTRLQEFLQPLGWTTANIVGAEELRVQFLAPSGLAAAPLAEGECLCLATRLSLS